MRQKLYHICSIFGKQVNLSFNSHISQNNFSSGQNVIFYHLDVQSKSLNKTRRLIGHGGSLKSSIYLTRVMRILYAIFFYL